MAYELDMLQRLEQVRDGLKRLEKTVNTIANGMAVQADQASEPVNQCEPDPEPEPVRDRVGNRLHLGDTVFVVAFGVPIAGQTGTILGIYGDESRNTCIDVGRHANGDQLNWSFEPHALVRIPNPEPDAEGYREYLIRMKCTPA